jgi:hypothetical protein
MRSSKETIASEDETKSTCLDKVSPSIEEIDSTINQLLKNPPLDACPFNNFRDVHMWLHAGINPHRLRIGEDVLESEMVQEFGLAKRRSRYSFVNVHDDKVLDRIRELYPMEYGKPIVPKSKLLGKEFTKGIVAKVVQGMSINWANFGHETNINQGRKWQSKLDTLIAKKASLLGTYVV